MILLPHGCSCSTPAVNPKNWKTGGKSLLKKDWRIHYYFRDPEFKDRYPNGKMIPLRGMNHFKTVEERRQITQAIINEELYHLTTQGYNPITKMMNGPEIYLECEIHPDTPICEAVEIARKQIDGAKSTLSDLRIISKYFIKSCKQLRYHVLRISDVKRIHIKNILDNQKKQNGYSNERFNKARAYMHMIFKELVLSDAIDYNLVTGIPKKKETIKIREILTDDEVILVKNHLKTNHYGFYRYMQIFFHSGSRSTELFNLKKKDVDLKNSRFKVLVKKSKNYEEQWRAINKNAFGFWNDLYKVCGSSEDYLFSYNFCPGPVKIAARQVSDKWREYVKHRLGITADFYSLKHLHTTKVIDAYDRGLAAGINGHKSNAMNDRHYDVLHQQRILETAKHIDISF